MSNANTSLPKGKLTNVEGHVIVSYALMIIVRQMGFMKVAVAFEYCLLNHRRKQRS
jgi:hypothetical protein